MKRLSVLLPLVLGLLSLAPDCDEPIGDGEADTTDASSSSSSSGEPAWVLYAQTDCQKRGQCIIETGGAFSQTECEAANQIEAERAESRQCSEAYEGLLRCAASINYDCSRLVDVQLNEACSGWRQPFIDCMAR